MNSTLLRAGIASTLCTSFGAAAEDATHDELETVVVVAASGRAEQVLDIPQTIDVVSSDTAAAAQPTWIGEVLNKLPGVYFAQLRGPIDMPAIRLP